MKRSIFLCVLSGLLLALSFPMAIGSGDIMSGLPNAFIIFIAFVPFFMALEETKRPHPFLKGMATGFVFFAIGLFWFTVAMHLFGDISIAGSIGILLSAVAFQSLYLGLFGWCLKVMRRRFGLLEAAPLLFAAVELLRTYLVAGFTWLSPAYALVKFEKLIQVSDLLGPGLLNLFIVIVNVALYRLIVYATKRGSFPKKEALCAACLLIGFAGYGYYRVSQIERLIPASSERISLIQGNIPQDQKWSRYTRGRIIEKYLALSNTALPSSPSLIVWPEASLPYTLNSEAKRLNILPAGTFGSNFILGAIFTEREGRESLEYNSAFYLDSSGSILGRFDKIHLVPFSEEVLFESFIPFIRKVIPPVAGAFRPGKEFTTFDLAGKKFAVLICFEVIFPDISRKYKNLGADFLVNITNDAWFGKTSGPYQHFEMIRLRAVENRIPIVRAANTGISGVIDELGRVSRKSSLFEDEVINAAIDIKKIGSLYSKIGDVLPLASLLASIIMLVLSLKRRKG